MLQSAQRCLTLYSHFRMTVQVQKFGQFLFFPKQNSSNYHRAIITFNVKTQSDMDNTGLFLKQLKMQVFIIFASSPLQLACLYCSLNEVFNICIEFPDIDTSDSSFERAIGNQLYNTPSTQVMEESCFFFISIAPH